MRRPLTRAAMSVVAVVCAVAIVAGQDNWYTSYKDAVKAFNSGDYPTAEKKLLAALGNRNTPKERGRRVLYYGQIRDEFFPEYYLALTYDKLGKWSEAVRYAKDAEKYLKNGDPEFQKLAVARADAEKGMTPTVLVSNGRGVDTSPPTGGGNPGRGTTPPEDAGTAARRRFDTLVADITRFTSEGRFAQARQAATEAKGLNVDNSRIDTLLRNADLQDLQAQLTAAVRARAWTTATPLVDRLVALDPASAAVRDARSQIARGLSEDRAKQLERDGLAAFYRGQYQRALDTLGQVAADVRTPRVFFYQACSTAALGLLDGDKAKLQKAHDLFLQARPKENRFTVERKYVSPRITQVLDASS